MNNDQRKVPIIQPYMAEQRVHALGPKDATDPKAVADHPQEV
jgi:hypothetical protein